MSERRNENAAISYETFCSLCGDAGKAYEVFSAVSRHADISQPFSSYASSVSGILGCTADQALEVWRGIRDSFEKEAVDFSIISEASPLFPRMHSMKIPFIYAAGDTELLKRPRVTVLGTLQPSLKGKSDTLDAVSALASSGTAVMAPLEKGIAAAALSYAAHLSCGAIAVMPSFLSHAPSSDLLPLLKELYEKALIITPFPPSARTERWFQKIRNDFMAAISSSIFIPEEKDGGAAWSVARLASEHKARIMVSSSLVSNHSLSFPSRFVGEGAKIFRKGNDILRIAEKASSDTTGDLFS